MSTHALRTTETPLGLRILRVVDLIVLGIALPVWVAAGLPMLGWLAATASWLVARWFQSFIERRAYAKGTRQSMLGARAASLLARLYLVTASVFVAGLIDRKAGLSGAVLAIVVFTVHFVSLFIVNALEEDPR